ncbi:MAG: hypothetical protein K0R67_3981 [Paenibacillus sp.]|jgi:hypothetical protein|nr:hypothetical protein [Paenibacillus sp.]
MNVPLLFGPYGSANLPLHVSEYGVSAVWFHGFNEQSFSDCEERKLAPCVEFKTFRADFSKYPELIPIGIDGKPIRYGRLVQGICLSRKEYLAEIEQNLISGLKQFKPRGVWLDYLTYAGWFETPEPDLQESCFCADCIEDFCQGTGVDAVTPGEILSTYAEEWKVHKCRKIADYGRHYAAIIKRTLPDGIVGAYMCPWTPEQFDGALTRIFAQDYDQLADAIDVFTPLIYTAKSGQSAQWGREWLSRSPEFVPASSKVQLILDAKDYPDSCTETAASPVPSWGLQLFAGAPLFQDPVQSRAFQMTVEAIRNRIGV